jgi:hypothetical protein
MRPIRLIAAALAIGLAATLTGTAAAAGGLNATFTIHFPKGHPASNAPCPSDAFCGVGSIAGYGAATITVDDESFQPIAGSDCFAVTRVEELSPLAGDGALVLDEEGTFCRPGGSGDSNASPQSYGAPGVFDLTYNVDGSASSGTFAGASGSGRTVMTVAGGVGVWKIRGSLRPA